MTDMTRSRSMDRAEVTRVVRRLLADESGAVHFEYALLAALMGTGLIAALVVLQGGLDNAYNNLSAMLDSVR